MMCCMQIFIGEYLFECESALVDTSVLVKFGYIDPMLAPSRSWAN